MQNGPSEWKYTDLRSFFLTFSSLFPHDTNNYIQIKTKKKILLSLIWLVQQFEKYIVC